MTHAITVGRGRTEPQGHRVTLDGQPVGALARAIEGHLGIEAWWCASTFRECHQRRADYRHGDGWESASAIALDADYEDAEGKHAPIPPEVAAAAEVAIREMADPPNILHRTPRGLRPVYVLAEPVTERDAFVAASRGAARWLSEALAHVRGLAVDTHTVGDCARFLWTPRATVDGHVRSASVEILREEPYPLHALAAAGPSLATAGAAPTLPAVGLPERIARARAYLQALPPAISGQRGHDATWRAALAVGRGFDLPEAEALALLREYSARCLPSWSEAELAHKLGDALHRARVPRGYLLDGARRRHAKRKGDFLAPSRTAAPAGEAERFTDVGNAARFVRDHGQDLRYCYPWNRWLAWDGQRWNPDAAAEIERRAKQTARGIFTEAANARDDAEAARLARHAVATLAARALRSMTDLARCELEVRPEALDRDPWALNVPNGTIDLRSGTLRPHRRENFITKLAPVPFDPEARAPTWDRFLARIFDNNANLFAYIRRVVGYGLTASVREDALFILHGTGANGKSTLLGAIRQMLGRDYASEAPPELLLVKRGEAHPTERADLFGQRFVTTTEIQEGRRFAEALVKALTGRDSIKARRMREDFWEFEPSHKIYLATNSKPEVRGTDLAFWRRIRLIPFNVTIPTAEQDRDLPAKLAAELPGILAWAVRGAVEWSSGGLQDPPEVLAATEEYRVEEDVLGDWIGHCARLAPGARVSAREAYHSYRAFMEVQGQEPIPQRAFARRLTERGIRRIREGHENRTTYCGIGLLLRPDSTREPGGDG